MLEIRSRTQSRVAAALAIALLGLVADPSFAKKKNNDKDADEQIQTMSVELKQLEVEDQRNAATAEIGKAEALRDKARSIIGERKQRDVLKRTLQELEATIALAAAKIVEAEKRAKLEAKQQELSSVQKELKTVRSEVERLEQEQTALERKLGGGK